ncbi:hypothetical protein [Acinetobacter gerneri]|uniref:hypothetical protein n=1 Tax=Acinetobacter gerneri TaxID=202952 RepID=UPI0028ADDEDF|nr:hypothetical protein [Acinetobacter gerneri]
MGIRIKVPRYAAKKITRFVCPDCKKNSRCIAFFEHWHGWSSTCLNCGRCWDNGEWIALEFYRGVRKQNIDYAKRLWRKLSNVGSEINFDDFEVA